MPEASNIETLDTLNLRLEAWSQRQLTGCILVQAGGDLNWNLYLFMGRLVWAKGGRYPYRRWQRLVRQHFPAWYAKLRQRNSPEDYCLAGEEYSLLVTWLSQNKVSGDQAATLTRGLVAEVLFDILQCEETKKVRFEENRTHSLNSLVTVLNPEQVAYQAACAWKKWKNAGLTHLSPDLAPVIRRPESLRATLSEPVYQTLNRLLNGNQTLRDIGLSLKQDMVLLIRTLAPHIRNKEIELLKVADLAPPEKFEVESLEHHTEVNTLVAQVPLVIGIDDSFLEKQILERHLKGFGCRFIGIEDAVQALPLLVEHQPDLVFLDLVMPIANGYEICAQIRKIAKLKDTPVVILTGNDGIVDRVRAKLVGATDFIGKPVEERQVALVLQRYLPQFSGVTWQQATPR